MLLPRLRKCLAPLPGRPFRFVSGSVCPRAKRAIFPAWSCRLARRARASAGICQLSNLLYWLVLHSPLTGVERHHHSFDPFPDEGGGCSSRAAPRRFTTIATFSLRIALRTRFSHNLWLSSRCLEGGLRVDAELAHSYHVFEKEHAFLKREGKFFRKNELWRNKIDKRRARGVDTELIVRNFAEVKYVPAEFADAKVGGSEQRSDLALHALPAAKRGSGRCYLDHSEWKVPALSVR